MKPAFIFLSLAFAVACNGLWLVMRVLEMLHRAYPLPEHHNGGGVLATGSFEIFCFKYSSWLPYLAIPAIIYALIVVFRGKASVERFCLFASVLAFVFMILFFAVAVNCMIGWIALYG